MILLITIPLSIAISLAWYLPAVKAQGEKVHSGSLIASGSDAMFDAILSSSVLASAIIFMVSGLSLEAYVGAVISVIIIKSGVEMMSETLNDILGTRADRETTSEIKKILTAEKEVRGAYDLIIHNYGPDKNVASVHIELPDTMTINEVDKLTRNIEAKVYRETGIILTGIGIYSYNTSDDEAAKIRNAVQKTVLEHDWALQMHGFYADTANKTIRFDVVISFDIDRAEALDILTREVQPQFPDYSLQIVPDIDA